MTSLFTQSSRVITIQSYKKFSIKKNSKSKIEDQTRERSITADKLKFLGFELRKFGIKSIPEKLRTMTDFEAPKCKKTTEDISKPHGVL